ncbi:hypothetical protein D5C48_23080 [Salmonella enterica subsp. enterica]|nr:hypothetical protein [Salmonella enterica subsp. enterica serovar Pomona]
MGAKRYYRAVLRGVLPFSCEGQMFPLLNFTEAGQIRQFTPPPCKAITGLQRVCSQVKAEAPVSGQDGACDVLSVISGVLTGVTSGNSRLEA